MILALVFALAIGFSLTVLGSGGSIITLPVLVYAARIPPQEAVGMSLAVVGGTSLTATVLNMRSGHVHLQAATLFSLTGIVGALAGRSSRIWSHPAVLMLIFAGLMIVVRHPHAAPGENARAGFSREVPLAALLADWSWRGRADRFSGGRRRISHRPRARLFRSTPAQIRFHHFPFRDCGEFLRGARGASAPGAF